jgi:hypothetical protein
LPSRSPAPARRRPRRGCRPNSSCANLAANPGVGLAAAILIDATIIRAVLLPATMKLLGERNWYLPRRLGWLPRTAAATA